VGNYEYYVIVAPMNFLPLTFEMRASIESLNLERTQHLRRIESLEQILRENHVRTQCLEQILRENHVRTESVEQRLREDNARTEHLFGLCYDALREADASCKLFEQEIREMVEEKERLKPPSLKTKNKVWFRDNKKCDNCGLKFVESKVGSVKPWTQIVSFHFCHVKAQSFGGTNTSENIVLGCEKCDKACGQNNWNEWKNGKEAKRIANIKKNNI